MVKIAKKDSLEKINELKKELIFSSIFKEIQGETIDSYLSEGTIDRIKKNGPKSVLKWISSKGLLVEIFLAVDDFNVVYFFERLNYEESSKRTFKSIDSALSGFLQTIDYLKHTECTEDTK